jgi:hypothetical protein
VKNIFQRGQNEKKITPSGTASAWPTLASAFPSAPSGGTESRSISMIEQKGGIDGQFGQA